MKRDTVKVAPECLRRLGLLAGRGQPASVTRCVEAAQGDAPVEGGPAQDADQLAALLALGARLQPLVEDVEDERDAEEHAGEQQDGRSGSRSRRGRLIASQVNPATPSVASTASSGIPR